FEDPGIAGGEIEHRPGLQAMLEFCEQRFRLGDPVEAVLVWNPDRLSRADSISTSSVLGRLRDAGVNRFWTASDGWVDLDDATHRVLYLLKQDLARQGFCEGLAHNVLRGMARKAEAGAWLGGPVPYGYRVRYKEGVLSKSGARVPDRLVPDPVTGPVVTWIFSSYASGAYSLRALALRLREDGVAPPARRKARSASTPPGAWHINTLAGMLANEVYLGHTTWNLCHRGHYARLRGGRAEADDTAPPREQERSRKGCKHRRTVPNAPEDVLRSPNTHEPLTDPATFEAVRRRLEANRGRKTPLPNGGGWLLSGLVRCGACGG